MILERFYSNMHHMIIPLYGFKNYHHANNNGDEIDDFIGRSSIKDKLASWLRCPKEDKGKKKNLTRYKGAYLITGNRGMGKSTFVHSAIKKLQEETPKQEKYIPVTVNVGNELLAPRDLLSIICKLTEQKFEKILRGKAWVGSHGNVITISVIITALCYLAYLLPGNNFTSSCEVVKFIAKSFLNDKNCFILIVTYTISALISYPLLYVLWKVTNWNWCITIRQIKREWGYLLERINAAVTTSTEVGNQQKDESLYSLGLFFKYGKTMAYPIADVPEMQELMVRLLDLIKLHSYTRRFHFIFIIDELDKISPKDDEDAIIPEYNTANSVNGESTYRSRTKSFCSLVANLKYFISSSNAKFVFVTGYDMYEATLSDISNRDFNIHSIFNGHINVSSFFRRTENFDGIDAMIEQYLCHLLLDKSTYEETSEKLGTDKNCLNLNSYSKYCRYKWNNNNKQDDSNNNKEKNDLFEKILERRVTFLHYFLTYLIYMSNGSPKKLAMYIERNIRTKAKINPKIDKDKEKEPGYDIHLGNNESEYYLYFDNRNIQKICFINYLIYPMIHNLVDKSNIYNDKLLVSTSFMISNLYKFHKSGFSMRNLEYMPELLDINKTPELRDFIGGIVDFLEQVHVEESLVNLYKYKFPLRLSEEITFFSKKSEEVTYLFNFSHDELLSIKKLYERQLKKYGGDNVSDIMGRASLHHMLGDIYMIEENFEQAIFEYQEALRSWKQQTNDCVIVKEDSDNIVEKTSSQILFYIRLSLKLGLAYEKRKTFDTAYFTYENLVLELLKLVDKIPNGETFLKKYASIIIGHKIEKENALENRKTLFFNIRITLMAILAKLFVLEKMDLGGFRPQDIMFAINEMQTIKSKIGEDMRYIVVADFYTKLGEIFFYKNPANNDFVRYLKIEKSSKILECFQCERDGKCLKPCMSCLCYQMAINEWGKKIKNEILDTISPQNMAIDILKLLSDDGFKNELLSWGNVQVKSLCNTIVGFANAQLGCAKDLSEEQNVLVLHDFFSTLNEWIPAFKEKRQINFGVLESKKLSPFMTAILSYWEASELFNCIGEAKSAYESCFQILNAIYGYYSIVRKERDNKAVGITSSEMILIDSIAQDALKYAYDHYCYINFAEIDKLKQMLGRDATQRINLNDLSNYPDMERVLFLQYKISLLSSDISTKYSILREVLKSSQMGWDKLICSLSQNIQNLDFKITINEQILLLLLPDIYMGYDECNHSYKDSETLIKSFLNNGNDIKALMDTLEWYPCKNKDDRNGCENKENQNGQKDKGLTTGSQFELLQYLVVDSMFSLNKIADLLSPLYCTTLYTNEYLGKIYEKGFLWGHLLRVVNNMVNDNKQIEDNFKKIFAAGRRNFEYRYLVGCAKNYYRKAIEMHTSGKMYKDMMTMMYVLEDDLRNDTCYFDFAIEMMHMNLGYLDRCQSRMESYYNISNSLFDKQNYINKNNSK